MCWKSLPLVLRPKQASLIEQFFLKAKKVKQSKLTFPQCEYYCQSTRLRKQLEFIMKAVKMRVWYEWDVSYFLFRAGSAFLKVYHLCCWSTGFWGQLPTDNSQDSCGTTLIGSSKRYPLPCCAYSKIRKHFPSEDGQYHGFEDEDN